MVHVPGPWTVGAQVEYRGRPVVADRPAFRDTALTLAAGVADARRTVAGLVGPGCGVVVAVHEPALPGVVAGLPGPTRWDGVDPVDRGVVAAVLRRFLGTVGSGDAGGHDRPRPGRRRPGGPHHARRGRGGPARRPGGDGRDDRRRGRRRRPHRGRSGHRVGGRPRRAGGRRRRRRRPGAHPPVGPLDVRPRGPDVDRRPRRRRSAGSARGVGDGRAVAGRTPAEAAEAAALVRTAAALLHRN